MIQNNQFNQNQEAIDSIFRVITLHVQKDEYLRQMFIILGQALSSEINGKDMSPLDNAKEEPAQNSGATQTASLLNSLDLSNGVASTKEYKVQIKNGGRTSNTKIKRKTNKHKRGKVYDDVVYNARELLSINNINQITLAGQSSIKEKVQKYKKALGVKKIDWIESVKKSSHKRFAKEVRETNPQLVIVAIGQISHQKAAAVKDDCKDQAIPHMTVRGFGGVNIIAHEIMNQVSKQIAGNFSN